MLIGMFKFVVLYSKLLYSILCSAAHRLCILVVTIEGSNMLYSTQ